jgi:hypothetical protein
MCNILELINLWSIPSIHWIDPCHPNEELSFCLTQFHLFGRFISQTFVSSANAQSNTQKNPLIKTLETVLPEFLIIFFLFSHQDGLRTDCFLYLHLNKQGMVWSVEVLDLASTDILCEWKQHEEMSNFWNNRIRCDQPMKEFQFDKVTCSCENQKYLSNDRPMKK